MNIVALIQARTGSSRLPNKVLMDLSGKTVLERVVERVKKAKYIKDVIVVTTFLPNDLSIIKLCADNYIRVFCGSENDVLDRFYQIAKLIQPDHIVRITSDCPLVDPVVIDEVIEKHLSADYDYTSNTIIESYPDGEDVEIFKMSALEKAWKEAALVSEREHVTPYIKKNTDQFKQTQVVIEPSLNDLRWTLDKSEDYELIQKIYNNLYPLNPFFGMKEILCFLEQNPELKTINRGIIRNEGYLKSLREDKIAKQEAK